jgi:hypothetical protein
LIFDVEKDGAGERGGEFGSGSDLGSENGVESCFLCGEKELHGTV